MYLFCEVFYNVSNDEAHLANTYSFQIISRANFSK